MEPNVVAVLAGGAGALGMLLIVLLILLAFAWPLVRSLVRFVGNFQTVNVSRAKDGIRFAGAIDDWREPSEQPPAAESGPIDIEAR